VSSATEPIPEIRPRVCSIADALQLVGERWSLLAIREIGLGARRFNDIQANTGAPRETLSVRLRKLEDADIIERRRYSDHPPRDEYVLTEAGTALVPILRSLRLWGEQYATPQRHPFPRLTDHAAKITTAGGKASFVAADLGDVLGAENPDRPD